ncbi:type II secretion system pilot lipoprotein GspS-beta [Vibrio sp. HN007]|uniref:type II secretion system pilot lipoprotein GspS-beta n=1 Tax=Vibrio iocasae TaxID=3098914 RepID=UPI0035D3F284
MTSKVIKIISLVVLSTGLFACSSTREQDAKIEAIASHRAQILSAGLPIEHGPLTVMQAKADGKVINMLMIYNSSNGQLPEGLLDKSTKYYCSNNEIKTNLEQGISYKITIKNSRGQTLVEHPVSQASCE